MRLICMMPVGPGEADRHLGHCLRAAGEWADLILVYGDAVDEKTRDLIYAHSDRFEFNDDPEPLYAQGEHMVRNQLWKLADRYARVGDLICSLDADEQFQGSPDSIRERLKALEDDPHEAFTVSFYHLWNPRGTMHRVDGAWYPSVGPRLCKHRPGNQVQPLHPGAWVSPPMPPHLMRGAAPSGMKVLHWSYAREKDRAPKMERYLAFPGHSTAHVRSIVETPVVEPVPCN